jgi:peptide/nickel transport system substrate-binding protein
MRAAENLGRFKPPFNNPAARRALAYALDRQVLATEDGGPSGRVTCQLIPPDFAGYHAYCPFTVNGGRDGQWHAQDLATAQKLVRQSGARGAKVVVSLVPGSVTAAMGRSIVGVLKQLGFRASLAFRSEFFTPKKDWSIGETEWAADYPATSNYLGPASCDRHVEFFNLSHYCSTEITAQITAALAQQETNPGSASSAWTAIDREVVDAAAVIPFDDEIYTSFVSRRVGNLEVHPITGPLIDQMWVQ